MVYKLSILLLLPSFLVAQQTINVDKEEMAPVKNGLFYTVAGVPISLYKYVRVVSGSPYFKDDWMKGIAVLANGTRAKCDQVKLDLLSGDIIYKDSTGAELTAVSPITRLTLTDPASGKEFIFSNTVYPATKKSNAGWYQVLESGTATLYKKIKKVISESTPFNSATTEQTINTASFYFIAVNDDVTAIKKPKDIPDVLSDKKTALDEFITAKKLTGKTDIEFTEVVVKYNELAITN